jgi:hypothetical protein
MPNVPADVAALGFQQLEMRKRIAAQLLMAQRQRAALAARGITGVAPYADPAQLQQAQQQQQLEQMQQEAEDEARRKALLQQQGGV